MESSITLNEPEMDMNEQNTSSSLPITPEDLMVPLMNNTTANSSTATATTTTSTTAISPTEDSSSSSNVLRRLKPTQTSRRQARRRTKPFSRDKKSNNSHGVKTTTRCGTNLTRYMQVLARILVWASVVSLSLGVVWYSYELTKHGTDPHLIAWFSAGAFVLLGFPISMYGIVMHLANYNEPLVQCYVVRILWMVPIYSMESWLCLRFHKYAIYIETLRDVYESYVLYCFLQFLIQVLGGEEELINLLRTKSPTRGVHMWGLQWCVRPWLMGQPLSRNSGTITWTSPFFVKCKFGVLQYVLLKFVSSIIIMVLELNHVYKEGDFTPTGGYLYICILTNVSQCWALYCMIFFYYATKNELGPIRPVGKFLSVKALVFFTWWQSVAISLFYQMDMIPHYHAKEEWTSEDVAKGLQDYLICIEMFLAAIVHVFVFPHTDHGGSSRKLSTLKVEQKRLGRRKILGGGKYGYAPWKHATAWGGDADSRSSKNSGLDYDLELASHASSTDGLLGPIPSSSSGLSPKPSVVQEQDGVVESSSFELGTTTTTTAATSEVLSRMPSSLQEEDDEEEDDDEDDESDSDQHQDQDSPVSSRPTRPGFVSALLDSTIPRDVVDNTAGIVKGAYHVEKRTLLHHATTADQYDLFRNTRKKSHQQHPQLPP